MIPDIAFMIVIYGCARLAVTAIGQHRTGTNAFAQAAPWLVWIVAVMAAGGLLLLGFDVYSAAKDATASVPNLTR